MTDCIFCKILNGDIPSKIIYQDDYCFAINDINPKAKKHILVIPKDHVACASEVEDFSLFAKLFEAISKINKQEEITDYRLQINNGKSAGQEVMHLHLHILAN